MVRGCERFSAFLHHVDIAVTQQRPSWPCHQDLRSWTLLPMWFSWLWRRWCLNQQQQEEEERRRLWACCRSQCHCPQVNSESAHRKTIRSIQNKLLVSAQISEQCQLCSDTESRGPSLTGANVIQDFILISTIFLGQCWQIILLFSTTQTYYFLYLEIFWTYWLTYCSGWV